MRKLKQSACTVKIHISDGIIRITMRFSALRCTWAIISESRWADPLKMLASTNVGENYDRARAKELQGDVGESKGSRDIDS